MRMAGARVKPGNGERPSGRHSAPVAQSRDVQDSRGHGDAAHESPRRVRPDPPGPIADRQGRPRHLRHPSGHHRLRRAAGTRSRSEQPMTATRTRRGRQADSGPVPRPEQAARTTSRRNHVATSQQSSSPLPSADEWLTVEEICTELKISRRTFDRWRARGTGRGVNPSVATARCAPGEAGSTPGPRTARTPHERRKLELRRQVLEHRHSPEPADPLPGPLGCRRSGIQRLIRHVRAGRCLPVTARHAGPQR